MVDIDGYVFPEDLLYDRHHNWARIEGDVATVGLSDFGQALAGEIIFAEMPRLGRQIEAGEPFMSLESGKWVGRIKAIVSGKIVAVNEDLEWQSTLINSDPYGRGWFVKVELSDPPQGLMKATDPEFAAFIAAEREKHGR